MPDVGCYLTEALSDGHLTLTAYGYGSFACVLGTVSGLFIADKNRLLKHKNLYPRVFNRLISNKNPLKGWRTPESGLHRPLKRGGQHDLR